MNTPVHLFPLHLHRSWALSGMDVQTDAQLGTWIFNLCSLLTPALPRETCTPHPLLIVQPYRLCHPRRRPLPRALAQTCSFPKRSQPYSLAHKTSSHPLSPFTQLISCLSYPSLCHHFPLSLDASSCTPSQVSF